jgi:hypothetical protein
MFIEGCSIIAVTAFLAFEINGCSYTAWSDAKEIIANGGFPTTTEAGDYYLDEDDHLKKSCSIFYLANTTMSIGLTFILIMSKLTFAQMTTNDLFTFKLKRFQLFAFVLAMLPTFAATFLFARREQISNINIEDKDNYELAKEPLM